MEISGNQKESIRAYQSAAELYYDLGKLRKVKEIKKYLSQIEYLSKQMIESDYLLSKFNIRRD